MLKRQFNLTTLDLLGDLNRAELAAAGALLDYVDLTQKGAQALIKPLQAGGTLTLMPRPAVISNLQNPVEHAQAPPCHD